MIGTRLGPYEITAKLGEGGMGEVYRATDTNRRAPRLRVCRARGCATTSGMTCTTSSPG